MTIFRTYDALRVFDTACQNMSFTKAAAQLNLTKGAISYQIKQLENELGFKVFLRHKGGVELTHKGKTLWQTCRVLFEQVETEIHQLKQHDYQTITIGMSTYFASRWLMPRLMGFTSAHPNIGLRLQPTLDLIDFKKENIDMAIRWGDGHWSDMRIKQLFNCPAIVTAGKSMSKTLKSIGLQELLGTSTLLHDQEGSRAWKDWHQLAGFAYQSKPNELVIPDPNVRVQAVINSQGLALNDALVENELQKSTLVQISNITLDSYGYWLAYPDGAFANQALKAFHDWIITEINSPT